MESDSVFRNYIELQKKEENEIHENSKCQDEEMLECKTPEEELEGNSQDHSQKDESKGENDDVSFLMGIFQKARNSEDRIYIKEM